MLSLQSRVEDGEAHDCWTTTEAALTRDLPEDLREAWERLRETAAGFGDQRIYASHNSIMFSRKSCYFFVRPKKSFLEVCVFLPRGLKHPKVRRADRSVEDEGREHDARHPPRRGGGAVHRTGCRRPTTTPTGRRHGRPPSPPSTRANAETEASKPKSKAQVRSKAQDQSQKRSNELGDTLTGHAS